MQAVILCALLAVAVADKRPTYSAPAPQPSYSAPVSQQRSAPAAPVIRILQDDRVHPEVDGSYHFAVETADGVLRQESGGPGGAQQGSVSFTFPDGQVFDLTFVADENGYQPQSSFLPVAPAFPHPIPQFVLDQIAFAAEQDAARARGELRQAPSQTPGQYYGAPGN